MCSQRALAPLIFAAIFAFIPAALSNQHLSPAVRYKTSTMTLRHLSPRTASDMTLLRPSTVDFDS